MTSSSNSIKRRNFIQTASVATVGMAGLVSVSSISSGCTKANGDSVFFIGPLDGYSPHIGTLVTMLNYNRYTIVEMVKNMTVKEIDYLHDEKSNTIASLLMHLGATETFYQINTFEGRQDYNKEEKEMWSAGMELGDDARKTIKGKEVTYYLNLINKVRNKTLEELKKKDDTWLLAVDPAWSKKSDLNTYWKWFHVCEHEANHRGQISWLRSRLPGAKSTKD